MTRQLKILCVAASMGLVVSGAVKSISACRCVEPKRPAEAYRSAEAVVVAKIVKLEPRPELGGFAMFLFVERAWKSEVNQELSVITGSDCLYSVEPDKKYLLFLTRTPEKVFTTGQCMGNRPLGDADKPLRWLETSTKPAPVIPPSCDSCHKGLP